MRSPKDPTREVIPLREAAKAWFAISLQTFGGPAGQIAVMQRTLVEEKRWIGQQRFLFALSDCTLLPGPKAQQLATYVGWLLNGIRGALVAGILFIVPGVVALLVLSGIYVGFGDTTLVESLFLGLAPAVIAIVVQAVVRVGRKGLGHPGLVVLAVSSFVALTFFPCPVPGGRGCSGTRGMVARTPVADAHRRAEGSAGRRSAAADQRRRPARRAPLATSYGAHPRPRTPRLVRAGAAGGARPGSLEHLRRPGVVLLRRCPGDLRRRVRRPRVRRPAGGRRLRLARAGRDGPRPGPRRDHTGPAHHGRAVRRVRRRLPRARRPRPVGSGRAGGAAHHLGDVRPVFLFILLGAPYVERLRGNRDLAAALAGITAAVVGVIASLAVFFALHTLFDETATLTTGPLDLEHPLLASLDPASLAITALGCALVFWRRWSVLRTLGACALTGIVVGLVTAG